MTVRALLAIAPVLWLASSAAGAPAFTLSPCQTVDGVAEILGPGRVVLLGEIHGTAESPAFVETLVCHALARELSVTVALELPQEEEVAVTRFLTGDEDQAGAAAVVALPFWAQDYQDGRTSGAMLRLLENIRGLIQAGAPVQVILLDRPQPFDQRDEAMAGRLLTTVEESPDDVFVVLTGNLHSRTASGSGRMGERVFTSLGAQRVVALDVSHSGGAAWICEMSAGCGPFELRGKADGSGLAISLFEETDAKGYQGVYFVGSITASQPARETAQETSGLPDESVNSGPKS